MKGDVQILYLIYYGFEPTVIESQVLVPFQLIQKKYSSAKIIFFEKISIWLKYILFLGLPKRYKKVNPIFYIVLPRVPRNLLFLNSAILWWTVRKHLNGAKKLIIHSRGFQGTHIALPMKKMSPKVKVICDSRGIEWAEYEYSILRRNLKPLSFFQNIWKNKLEKIEGEAVRNSDAVFGVTQPMIAYLRKRWNVNDKRFVRIPCAVNSSSYTASIEKRGEFRKKLNLQNRVVVGYSGSVENWHVPNQLIKAFQQIKKIDPTAFFMAITPTPKKIIHLLGTQNINQADYWVKKVEFNLVKDFLSASDIGLLIREENILNQMACPTKYAEYLSSGLHVLTTPAIEEIAKYTHENDVGTVISSFEDEEELKSKLNSALLKARDVENRIKKSRELARNLFDWGKFGPEIINSYEILSR